MKRIAVLFLIALLIAVAITWPFGAGAAYAAEDEYSYDTRYAGYMGRGLIHEERFAGLEKHYGIDVSAHQKQIDWKAVAESGCEFVFIRMGYRGYGTGALVEDEYAEYNIRGALENGIQVGVYLFSQAITVEECIEEADFVTELLEKYRLGPANIVLPVVYDVEFPYSEGKPVGRLYEANLDSRTRTDIALAFLERVKAAGYTPCFYGSRSAFNSSSKANMSEINGKYKIWLAAYTANKKSGYDGPYDFWQYSSSGKVPGIEGVVDLDVWYLDAKAQTGWVQRTFTGYIDPSTKQLLTGWQTIGGRTYHFGADGAMLTGWQDVDGYRAYFGQSGILRVGWDEIDGQRYYFGSKGELQTGWQDIDGSRYYFGTDGAMRTGPLFIDGKLYLFDMEGVMQKGWQVLADEFYYFGDDGAALTGRQDNGSYPYSFSEEGKLRFGLVPAGGQGTDAPRSAVLVTPWFKLRLTK